MGTDHMFLLLQELSHHKLIDGKHSYKIQNSEFVSSEKIRFNTKFSIKGFHIPQ
jgi:hypothetical protein